MTRKSKKLNMNRETLRSLSTSRLALAAGGADGFILKGTIEPSCNSQQIGDCTLKVAYDPNKYVVKYDLFGNYYLVLK
jgi:hypothetical protein